MKTRIYKALKPCLYCFYKPLHCFILPCFNALLCVIVCVALC